MGILFNRKTSSGFTIAKKQLGSRDPLLHNKTERKQFAKSMEKYFRTGKKVGARNELIDMLKKDRTGNYKKDEAHREIQTLIGEGAIVKKNAMKMAEEWGLSGSVNKKYRKFMDASAYRALQRKQELKDSLKKEHAENYNIQNKKPEIIQNDPSKGFPVKKNLNKLTTPPSSNKSQPTLRIVNSINIPLQKTEKTETKKPSNIWEILNRQKHPDAFPDDAGENQKEAT